MIRILAILFLIFLQWNVSFAENKPQKSNYQLPVMTYEKNEEDFWINKPNQDYLEYMWESFVALSWANEDGRRGKPDKRNKIPASKSPLVWESYPQPQEVFLSPAKWDNYPTWEKIPDLPVGMKVKKIKKLCNGFSIKKDIVLYDINQPNIDIRMGAVAPLIDQHRRYVRYQVTMNRSYFEYVAENQYYDAGVQEKAVRISQDAQYKGLSKKPKGAFIPLPTDQKKKVGMIETKAAWRILDPKHDDPNRYYTRSGFILSPDKTSCVKAPAGVGLVALHIHRLTKLSHVASTFEQIDNVEIIDPEAPDHLQPSFNPGRSNLSQENIWPPYGNRGFTGPLPPLITAMSILPEREFRQPNNISRATEIPPEVRKVNRKYQHKYQNSLLKYYQMINVQHARSECRMKLTGDFSNPMEWQPTTCPQPNENRLINAALESYTQLVDPYTDLPYNYSCQDCHSHARPCGFSGEIKNKLTFKPEFQVMSYLLSKAHFQKQLVSPDGYSCNNPATQPIRSP